MKIITKLIAFSIFSLFILFGCKSTVEILPEGNVEEINSKGDDFAPVQKPEPLQGCGICGREFLAPEQGKNDGVNKSRVFISEILAGKILEKADAISYLDHNSGFFSLSHPGYEEQELMNSPLNYELGGTDILAFQKIGDEYIFSPLDALNSFTWDSHPFAIMNDSCNVLLIWSSDRKDPDGFSIPYRKLRNSDYNGNTDLYYAFRIGNEWTEPKNFNLIGNGINTNFNEETPYIFCSCYRPVLIFSSDRNGSYDLFKVRLWVDIENMTLAQAGEVEEFPVGDNNINSKFKEFFPYVPYPISENPEENDLYFSSNRYWMKTPVNREQDTLIKNVGEFDIYRFPLTPDMKCTPPKLFYQVSILDINDPGREVRKPVVRITETGAAAPMQENQNNATFRLFPGKEYIIEGTSLWDQIDCIPGKEKTISHYAIRNIKTLEPKIHRRDTVITFKEFIERKNTVRIDTIRDTFLVPVDDLPSIDASIIKNIRKKGNKFEVETEELLEVEEIQRIDTVIRTKKMVLEDVIPQYDTTFIKLNDNVFALSEKTKRLGTFTFSDLKRDTTIKDTVYIWPDYYYFPPCEWKYITLKDYRKNVPYYQTGFWEVNTTENLKKHISLLKSKRFKDASFIELQPRNLYFGYKREGLSENQKQRKLNKWWGRYGKYKEYASQVDENLGNMAIEFCKKVMPTFDELASKNTSGSDKLFIIINAYSDIRPIESSEFISDTAIHYVASSFDTNTTVIENIYKVKVNPGESLDGASNDVLSKLRAYFGYIEVLERFKQCDLFNDYINNNEVLFPHLISSADQFREQYARSKIIFLIEGRQVDPTVTPDIPGYVGKPDDYKKLDKVRRIDVILKRVLSSSVEDIKNPECCRPPDKPPFAE
mgnify:CR=1 FL=1